MFFSYLLKREKCNFATFQLSDISFDFCCYDWYFTLDHCKQKHIWIIFSRLRSRHIRDKKSYATKKINVANVTLYVNSRNKLN